MHYIDPCVLVTDSDIWTNCRKFGVERTNSTVEVDHVLYVAHLYALLDQHISKHLHERTDHCSLPFLTSQLSSRMYFSLFRMRSAFTLLERLWWTGVLVDEVLNLLRLWPKPDTNPAANKSKHLHCTSLQITASHRSKRPTNFGFWRAKAWPGLSLSLPFFLFLTYQTGVLTRKTWSLSSHMTTLQPKVICRLAVWLCKINFTNCWLGQPQQHDVSTVELMDWQNLFTVMRFR